MIKKSIHIMAVVVALVSASFAQSSSPSAGPAAPANAVVYANLEKTNNWSKCSAANCSGGNPAGSYYAAPNQTTPSLDGSSTMFNISGGSYSDDLFSATAGVNPNASHYILDWNVYTDSNTYNLAQALEFDFIQVSGGLKFNFSSECNYAVGTWDTWNEVTQSWVHSNIACTKFAPNTWHHLRWYYERVGTQTHYISLTIDGVTYPVANQVALQPAPATNWANGALAFQVQQDLNSSGGSFTEWVDKATLYAW